MSDWVMALDNLAASGVIDYDAPAFIMGQQPRYVGHPELAHLSIQNPAFSQGNLNGDSFEKSNNLVQNPKWKKVLFAGVAIGGTLLIAASMISLKHKIKLPKFKKLKFSKLKLPKFSGIKTKTVNFGKKILSYVKKPINWVKGKIHMP